MHSSIEQLADEDLHAIPDVWCFSADKTISDVEFGQCWIGFADTPMSSRIQIVVIHYSCVRG